MYGDISMTAIEAVGLSKAFGPGKAAGRVQALDGLGLSVPRGTVCALLGPGRSHPVAASLAWTALLLAVFVPLATARYARPA
jgi:hypothetical protein